MGLTLTEKILKAHLVDGEFVEEKKNISLAFRGSENQRIIDLKKTFEKGDIVIYELECDKIK